jgi:hypothetical protein
MYVTVPYNKVLFSIVYFFNQPIGGWFWNCPRTVLLAHKVMQLHILKQLITMQQPSDMKLDVHLHYYSNTHTKAESSNILWNFDIQRTVHHDILL